MLAVAAVFFNLGWAAESAHLDGPPLPSEDDDIKVLVALPMKAWNGRFEGIGGGGYAGGSIESLNIPLAKGYAVGATDTGNEQRTANFAIDQHGKPAWQRMRDNAYVGI